MIGAILDAGEPAYRAVESVLAVDDLALERHRIIYRAMLEIGAEVEPRLNAVAHRLTEAQTLASVDGLAGLLDLHAKALPVVGLERVVRTLKHKSDGRRAARIVEKISKDIEFHGLNGNAPQIAAAAQELITLADGATTAKAITRVENLPAVYATTEPIRYVVEPELPEGAVIALTGDSGSGKSTLASAWVRDAIAAGRPCLILDRENPRSVVADRMARLELSDSPLLRWYGGWCGEVPGPDALVRKWVESCKPKPLVVIDSFIAFLESGSENDAGDVRRFMAGVRKLADRGATSVVIHHDGKAETARDFRGSSDFKAAVDQAFHVSNLAADGRLDRLHVRCFKSRFDLSGSIIYRYHGGLMVHDERTDAPARAVADELTALLRENPGCSGEQFEKLAAAKSVSRQRARGFLKDGSDGDLIRFEKIGNRRNYTLRSGL